MNKTATAQQTQTTDHFSHAKRQDRLQRKCDCGSHTPAGGECPACAKKKIGLQRKLRIGASNDPLEHEADRVADQVTAAPLNSDVSTTSQHIQRYAGEETTETDTTPVSVDRVLASSGKQLDPALQLNMGQRFGFDFSAVRIHTNDDAALRTRQLQAQAFTVGNNIFFDKGLYTPETLRGRWLLAHELTHVVQQARGDNYTQTFSEYTNGNGTDGREALEREADRSANQAVRGESVVVHGRIQKTHQTFPACRSIIDANEERVVAESDVQRQLALLFSGIGPVEREFPIPEGSFTPYRTDNPRQPDVIDPQIIGGRAGRGQADLALLHGQQLEVVEVKRGTFPLIVDAELQLMNYVNKANENLPFIQERWAQRHGHSPITSVRAMPSTRLNIPSPMRIAGTPTTTSWCRDGVIAFKAIGGQDSKIFVCGSMMQFPDQFVDSLISEAEVVVDSFIDGQLVPRIDQVIQSISVRRALEYMAADPSLRQLLGLVGSSDFLLDQLDGLLRGQADRAVRIAIRTMVDRVITEVRRTVKRQLRLTLQSVLNTMCATAAQLTAEEVLRELNRQMGQLVAVAIPMAIVAVLTPIIEELAAAVFEGLTEVFKYIAIAVGIVIAALVLWEVAAAIAASAAALELGAAITAFFAQLARALLPLVFA